MCFFFSTAVPGRVENLAGEARYTSVLLTWSAPSEPNGVIILYEVTYMVNDSTFVPVNSTGAGTSFTISPLTPSTRVSDITVSAYTSAGRGEVTNLPGLIVITQPRTLHNYQGFIEASPPKGPNPPLNWSTSHQRL